MNCWCRIMWSLSEANCFPRAVTNKVYATMRRNTNAKQLLLLDTVSWNFELSWHHWQSEMGSWGGIIQICFYIYIDRGKIWRKVSKFLGLWKFLNTYFCPSYWLLLEWYNGKCTDSYIVLFYTPGIFKALYTTLRIQPYTSIHTSTVIYAFSASWKHR